MPRNVITLLYQEYSSRSTTSQIGVLLCGRKLLTTEVEPKGLSHSRVCTTTVNVLR
jgi:hypothetical protein